VNVPNQCQISRIFPGPKRTRARDQLRAPSGSALRVRAGELWCYGLGAASMTRVII